MMANQRKAVDGLGLLLFPEAKTRIVQSGYERENVPQTLGQSLPAGDEPRCWQRLASQHFAREQEAAEGEKVDNCDCLPEDLLQFLYPRVGQAWTR